MTNVFAQDVVGQISTGSLRGGIFTQGLGGIGLLLSNVLRLFFVVAGILAFINLIIAGFQFINAGGDSKAVGAAWNRIWQSLLGLVLIVGSFALAAIFGQLIFGRADFILNPQIYGPGE